MTTLVLTDASGFERSAARAAGAGAVVALLAGVAVGPLAIFQRTASGAHGGLAWDVAELVVSLTGVALTWLRARMKRREAAERGELPPARWVAGLAMFAAAWAGVLALRLLPSLGESLAMTLASLWPGPLAPVLLLSLASVAVCGAAAGLWLVLPGVLLHVSRGGLVQERLRELQGKLGADLRMLAERAGRAHQEAWTMLQVQRPEGAPVLRGPLEALALLALTLAERAQGQTHAAAPAQERELTRRRDELVQLIAGTQDEKSRQNLSRALELQEQLLERHRELVRGRERLLSRLHAEVAELERARMSLSLLEGADVDRAAQELDLIGERLRAGADHAEASAGFAPESAMARAEPVRA